MIQDVFFQVSNPFVKLKSAYEIKQVFYKPMPINPVDDPTLPSGTTKGHLSFHSPGFRGELLGFGDDVANVFSPKNPYFSNLLNGFFATLVERYGNRSLGVRLNAETILFGIYKNEDPSFEHPECAKEARKFFNRVKATIPIWEDDTFEDKIETLHDIHESEKRNAEYSQGD